MDNKGCITMKMKDFIIDKYELGIKGNGRLSEEPLKISSLKDFPLEKCEYLSMGGNGNGFSL